MHADRLVGPQHSFRTVSAVNVGYRRIRGLPRIFVWTLAHLLLPVPQAEWRRVTGTALLTTLGGGTGKPGFTSMERSSISAGGAVLLVAGPGS